MVDYQKLFMTILHGLLNINVFFVVLVVLCSICTEFQHVLRNISVTVCFFWYFCFVQLLLPVVYSRGSISNSLIVLTPQVKWRL